MTHVAINIPTFNEVANVEPLLRSILAATQTVPQLSVDVLIVDDDSPDGTADEAERVGDLLGRAGFSVQVLRKPRREGFGAACLYGYKHALSIDGLDYVIQMDADLSHNPRYIPGLIHAANRGYQFVNASRYIPGGGTPDWSPRRIFLSRGGNSYARLILGSEITDYTGGFALYTTHLLRQLDLQSIEASGYGFQLQIKRRAISHSPAIAELPIVFLDREHGSSKMPKNTLWKNFWLVLLLRVRVRA